MRSKTPSAAFGLALALVCARPAAANPFETFGFGPRAQSMGGAATANAGDYTAVFYNPAMLVEKKDVNFGLTLSWYRPSATVEPTNPDRSLDCTYCTPPDSAGYSVGVLFPLGGKVKNHVALGLGAYLPMHELVRVQAVDPSRPFWLQYNSAQERLALYGGVGIRIIDSLSIGLGLQVLSDLVGRGASLQVDLFAKQVEVREIDASLRTRTAPTFGLMWAPLKRLRFGFNYRWEMALAYAIPASVNLDGVGTLAFTVHGVTHYTPHTATLGVAFDVTSRLTVTGDLIYARWSGAPSPYLTLDVDLSGDTLKALGLDNALDLTASGSRPGFQDTLSGKVGVEYRFSDNVTGRAGGFYRPTPVPLQDASSTNILDASAIGVSAGVGLSFADPLEVFAAPIHIDLATQAQFLASRKAQKDPTDPVASYEYSARVFGGSVALGYDF